MLADLVLAIHHLQGFLSASRLTAAQSPNEQAYMSLCSHMKSPWNPQLRFWSAASRLPAALYPRVPYNIRHTGDDLFLCRISSALWSRFIQHRSWHRFGHTSKGCSLLFLDYVPQCMTCGRYLPISKTLHLRTRLLVQIILPDTIGIFSQYF